MIAEFEMNQRQCSLLPFVATPTEEESLEQSAGSRFLTVERINDPDLGEYSWFGAVGHETVIAVRPVREHGRVVMGALGRLGSAARAIRFREATGAQGIVQIGMAFGVDPKNQQFGDVLVSSAIIPYDIRTIGRPKRANLLKRLLCGQRYVTDYSGAARQPARASLVELFLREHARGD